MATLKGQNFRILTKDGNAFKCIGMATGCTVTLGTNQDDESSKDDTGMASKPSVTSKNWSVSVESLSVADAASLLTAIKSGTQFTLLWDETNTSNNQTALKAAYSRQGNAYLNDVTFNFNDRENSTKSLQFTGSGPLEKVTTTPTVTVLSAGATTKGQFVRLYLSSDNSATPASVIAAAKSLSLHVSTTLEDATTKDTDGVWQIQEVTGISYDISSSALVRSNDVITSTVGAKSLADVEEIYEAATPVKWAIANASGANQRTKGTVIVSGSAVITQLTLNGPNKQNATYDTQLTGYGDYTVAA